MYTQGDLSRVIDISLYVYYSRHMDIQNAIIMFDALSQETRLRAFRLLVQAGPHGLAAGVLSETLGTPHNTLSFHLTHLSNAGLISSRKEGRSVIYSTNFNAMHGLISFMVKDCCHSELASVREDKQSGCSIIELADCCDVPSEI
jgi:ArsR family transcriptional regulator, arsenate/arsenite/antimonite-responsive transcriptional repressor